MGNPEYVIRGGVEGRERLRLLATVFGASTRALLDEVGVPDGARCLDIGCGGGDVTFELARMAGSTGRAVGVDRDATKIELARREAEQRGLANIVFEVGDVTAWEPDGPSAPGTGPVARPPRPRRRAPVRCPPWARDPQGR